MKMAINGFGRIGRLFVRAAVKSKDFLKKHEIVAINDLTDAKTLAHLFKYDSIHGVFDGKVEAKEGALVINGKEIKVLAEKDPTQLPWKSMGIEVVLESTGIFTKREDVAKHLTAGAKKVVVSAPGKNPDVTIVLGVNEKDYDPSKHDILSMASCTTNCLAPVAKVLHEKFGIEKGYMTTVHAYTNSQKLQDLGASDLRDARAAAQNIVPAATGAAKAVGLVIPELKGKFAGMAFRVPVATVSVVDFTAILNKEASKEAIREAMLEYANGSMKGILDVTDEPLVSCDLRGTTFSSVFSSLDTVVLGNMVKVVAWYDNEWGYACRLADVTAMVASKL